MFKVKMYVSYKDGIFDPAGSAVQSGLHSLGYTDASEVSVGKYITFTVNAADENKAAQQIKEMAEKLLTNPIIEKYTYQLEKA